MDIVVGNIKRIMAEKGLKQKYVAEKSRYSEQDFSNMMNGGKRIDVSYIPRKHSRMICFSGWQTTRTSERPSQHERSKECSSKN